MALVARLVNCPSWPVFLFKSSIQGHLGKASKAFSTLDFSFGVHGVGQAMKDVADRFLGGWEVMKWQRFWGVQLAKIMAILKVLVERR